MAAGGKTSAHQFQLFGDLHGPQLPKKPGDLSPEEWNAREDVSFHGSSVPAENKPFDQEYMHTGSERAATAILKTRAKARNLELDFFPIDFTEQEDFDTEDGVDATYREGSVGEIWDNESYHDYEDDPDYEPIKQDAPGRITGFRRIGSEVPATDRTANMAHVIALAESYGGSAEIPGSLRDSINQGGALDSKLTTVFPQHMELTDKLRSGDVLSYANDAEHIGSTSYVARRDSMRTYAEDVVYNSNRPEHVKEAWAQHLAGGHEGPHVPFEQLVGYQERLPLAGDRGFTVDTPLFNTVTKLKPTPPLAPPKKKKDTET